MVLIVNIILFPSYFYVYFIVVLFFWNTPSLSSIIYIFFAACSGTILHIAINHAYKLVDVSMTQPFSFLGLVFASLYGYFIFDEKLESFHYVGTALVFLGVYLAKKNYETKTIF